MRTRITTERKRRSTQRETASGLLIREVTYPQMRGRDRNAPCPCGSGRKFKHCHGQLV